jgi:hypothetical protein
LNQKSFGNENFKHNTKDFTKDHKGLNKESLRNEECI